MYTGSPNSLPTHRQTHSPHVQWSLEVLSGVFQMCVVQYLHYDGWKHTAGQNHMRPMTHRWGGRKEQQRAFSR